MNPRWHGFEGSQGLRKTTAPPGWAEEAGRLRR